MSLANFCQELQLKTNADAFVKELKRYSYHNWVPGTWQIASVKQVRFLDAHPTWGEDNVYGVFFHKTVPSNGQLRPLPLPDNPVPEVVLMLSDVGGEYPLLVKILPRSETGVRFAEKFVARCRELWDTPDAHGRSSQPEATLPQMSGDFTESESELAFLRRQLAEARENLRLIQERKSESVMGTDIPLQLVEEERQLLERIEELEQRVKRSEGTSDQAERSATPLEPPRKLRAFLCHASGDKPAVRDLYHRLCADGFDPWLDEEKLLPGQEWRLEILKAVRSSDAVVICLSRRAVTKAGYVQKEIKYALDVADEQPEGAIFLIPLRLEECEVPDRLRRWQWVDLFQETGYERLLRALRARAESLGLGTHPFEPAGDRWRSPKDGKEMVRVPAGKFLYGHDKKQIELPEFWIDETPVTNAEYARFVAETGHEPPSHWKGKTPRKRIADHPVTYVSWDDADAYAEWANGRLPSEEEWEKAARGTDGREYPWGEWAEGRCNTKEAGIGGTTPVGQYSPQGDSPYGCADMAGNVWEWTASEVEPGSGHHVLRGGSWGFDRGLARCADRFWITPGSFLDLVGLRVVVSLALSSSES